jgi:hypothetical protein
MSYIPRIRVSGALFFQAPSPFKAIDETAPQPNWIALYMVKLSIRGSDFTRRMVDDCGRAWECFSVRQLSGFRTLLHRGALPCWTTVHTGRSSVFNDRNSCVLWWKTALEHGSASSESSNVPGYGAVDDPDEALPCWTAVHTEMCSVFVGRCLLVQWWMGTLAHGSAFQHYER